MLARWDALIKGLTPNAPSLMDPSLWVPDVTMPAAGKCFTLDVSDHTLERDFVTGTILVELSKDRDYHMYVHDINYYVMNQNPFGIPVNFRSFSPEEGWTRIYKMRTVKRTNIHNCHSDPLYHFSSCVKRSLSKAIGCRLPWDSLTDQDMAVCTSMDQFR